MYKTVEVYFHSLTLDDQNPRFVTNAKRKPSSIEIIKYLIEFEEVIELAQSIKEYGGLVPGERLLVMKDKEKYIVLEGNRRTAAISLLLNPDDYIKSLSLKEKEFNRIKKLRNNIPQELVDNLSKFEVDIVTNRDSAIYSLTQRHIDGIKKWSQISKMYFYQKHFDSGKTINQLENFTGESSRTIADTLRKYSYLRFVLDAYREKFPNGKYNNSEIETNIPTELIIQRIFNSIRDRLKIQFDDSYRMITSHYTKEQLKLLKDILARIANLYWDLEQINTRNLNKKEEFENVFFNPDYNESSKESIIIGNLIIQLESSLNQSMNNDKNSNNKDSKRENEDDKQKSKVINSKEETKTYELFLEVISTKQRIKLYNDFDLMSLIIRATDSNDNDLRNKVTFNTQNNNFINNSTFSGDAPEGIYHIQAKLENNGISISKSLTLEVYLPKVTIKTQHTNNNLFSTVTTFSINDEIKIDINYTINGLINELQSLENPENYRLIIASSIRQLIELSVSKVITQKNLKNCGNTKENLNYLINEKFKEKNLFTKICNGENRLKYEHTKNLIGSIDGNKLWDYLNLITHDSNTSIYTDLVEKINKEIIPLLVVFHNYLKIQES